MDGAVVALGAVVVGGGVDVECAEPEPVPVAAASVLGVDPPPAAGVVDDGAGDGADADCVDVVDESDRSGDPEELCVLEGDDVVDESAAETDVPAVDIGSGADVPIVESR